MNKFGATFMLLFCVYTNLYGQKELKKDFDFDGITDTVYLDEEESKIVCLLSTKNFTKEESKFIDMLNEYSSIKDAKDGFYFNNDWMRSGYSNQFRYDKNQKKMQLIGMSRYDFGNWQHDGNGESSVNLLTDDYIGNWSYYDNIKDTLIKIPTIRTKMHFDKIYLENFDDEIYFSFGTKCSAPFD
ncbi:hypothetical protein L3073_04430 [Ancylomarina sp. DW003]|nr:hypothetical protein [Ancylomarina sp. DW003]MDE5421447.1 hypothetical protein [Ancylomarina sp. DW003]